MNTAEAIQAWVSGWTVSRGTAHPTPTAWGFTVDVGLPGHVVRHVLTTADEAAIRKITEATTAPGVWLKAPMSPEVLEPWLGLGWSLAGGPGFLMSNTLNAARPEAPPRTGDGYQLRTWTRAGVTHVLVRTSDGAFAARGQIAVAGPTAVVDQVETDPAHQRRGLGRLVLHTLVSAGAGQGATKGVLVATPEGRTLDEAAGWHVLAPLTGAMRN